MAENKTMNPELLLAQDMARFALDPMGFAMYAFPWGQHPLYSLVELKEPWASRYNAKYGPDVWTCELLDYVGELARKNNFDGTHAVKPQRHTIRSGHGIGKTFSTGLIVWWIMSCHPNCRGTITATTNTQIETKTWAQIASMKKQCITGEWFEITQGRGAMKMYHKDYRESWFCAGQSCKEENSEAFAGQHAAGSTSFYIFDEASGIPDKIWEVAEGGLTDGEPMIFAFGNPTKNSGKFYDTHSSDNRWHRVKIDSRESQLTNKTEIKEWEEQFGEESDFFKVRVRGEFPNAASSQFIPTGLVAEAMSKPTPSVSQVYKEKVFIGVDVARFGDDSSVIATRIGLDGRTFPLQLIKGADGRELGERVVAHATYFLDELRYNEVVICFDKAGVGAALDDYFRHELDDSRIRVFPIDFGAKALKSALYLNKRVEMYGGLKAWLTQGGVLPEDADLKQELISVEYMFTNKQQYQLERKEDLKERIGRSPDRADAYVLTFAKPGLDRGKAVSHNTSAAIGEAADRDYDPYRAVGRPTTRYGSMSRRNRR